MTTEIAASNGALPRNRLLAALPAEEWERVRGIVEPVSLELRHVLFEPNQRIQHVHFPEDAVVSILGLLEDGSAVETATVGYEGMVGVPVFLGAMQMAAQAFAQVPGTAWRMRADALRDEARRDSALARLLGRYTQALFTLVAQSSACNRKHSTQQRCARWLLMTHDRVGSDTFELTQLFLSQMLGVRRATVNETATALQERGLVDYVRGPHHRARPGGAGGGCVPVLRHHPRRVRPHAGRAGASHGPGRPAALGRGDDDGRRRRPPWIPPRTRRRTAGDES